MNPIYILGRFDFRNGVVRMMVLRREDSPEIKLGMTNSCLERLTGHSTTKALHSYSESESLELTEVLEMS